MLASEIAHVLGKPRREGRAWRCVCPLHGGHSLVLRDGDDALLVKCFGGNCEPEAILAELRRRGLIEGRDRERRQIRPPLPRQPSNRDPHEGRQHEKAAWLWSRCQPIGGSIAETYLRKARGINCALPPTLGLLVPYKPEHWPALIAAIGLPDEVEPGVIAPPGNVTAVHLTLLKPDGSGKADVDKTKLVIGSPGALPIVLAPVNDLGGLAVVEGIEDALSVYEATGLGAWAAGSAGRMPPLASVIPRYVEAVTIYGHDDKAGRLGARQLAENIAGVGGVEVFIEGLR